MKSPERHVGRGACGSRPTTKYEQTSQKVSGRRLSPFHRIHEPRGRNQEQRRQNVAQQEIEPGERKKKEAESEPSPECAKGSVCLHEEFR